MTTTLFRNGIIRRPPGVARTDWLLIEDATIVGSGHDNDAPSADRVVDLDGSVLLPAFVDAHVHLPATGLYEAGMNFRGEKRAGAILEAFKARAESDEGLLFGGNFEDPLDCPLVGEDLDAAVGKNPALLARADMHSCVVSSALLARLDLEGLEGVDRDQAGRPTGYLREKAAATAWSWFDRHLPADHAREAVRAAVRLAYSKGVASVHEMHVVEWRGWDALDVLEEAVSDMALEVVPYIATDEVDRIVERGLDRIGGDYFLDGSFGSHSAWMVEPFLSPPPEGTPPHGISYRDADELFEFFREAQAADLQVGVHAIGDAAIEQAIATWEKVAAELGTNEVRRKGHRIEHFECASDDHITRAAALGLRASIQPAFDRYWGGTEGLYAQRIGPERALNMNRFGAMIEAGLLVGAGSDSTVTPLDPFLQMTALRSHHVEKERCGMSQSLRLHSMGSRALAFGPTLDGTLEAGAVADLTLTDKDLVTVEEPEEWLDTQVLGTWIGGRRVWPPDEAETP